MLWGVEMSDASGDARCSSWPHAEALRAAHRRINRDRCGVEGIPLKLLITMVILAISLPMLFSWLHAYDGSQLRASLQTTVSRLTQYAGSAHASPESRRCVEVTVPTGTFVRSKHVRIGGGEGEAVPRATISPPGGGAGEL